MKIINKQVIVSNPLVEERGFFCNENDMKAFGNPLSVVFTH